LTSLSRTPAQLASLVGMILTPVFLVDAQDRGHHHAGAVGQRDEADLDFCFLRSVGTCGIHRSAQRRVNADGAHGSGLQNSAAAEFGFQKIRHVSSSRRFKHTKQRQKTKKASARGSTRCAQSNPSGRLCPFAFTQPPLDGAFA